jgi:enoyl-CoA hydratase
MPNEVLTATEGQVGVARINRPEASNALSQGLMQRLTAALQRFDNDPDIRCLLLLGDERAFAAGADVAELAGASLVDVYQRNPLAHWDALDRLRKPVVAAVCGYALGAGCELMMACDIVVAAETAHFGQPEITLGIIPGAGGTQRLTRALGKARAMDLILTGRMISAHEACQIGLVSRVVPRENCEQEARAVCRELCRRPPLALRAAKEAIRQAYETTLSEGLAYERQLFTLLFGTDDQKEGMRAFLEKRPPVFVGR